MRKWHHLAWWVCRVPPRYQAQKWSFLSEGWTQKSLCNCHFRFSACLSRLLVMLVLAALYLLHIWEIYLFSLFHCLKPPRQNVFSKHRYCFWQGHGRLDCCCVFYAAVIRHQARHICVLLFFNFNLEAAHMLNTSWSQHWARTHICT